MCLLSMQCRHRYPGGFELDIRLDVDVRFSALFGPSGSGKTTILSMIAGLVRPQAGTIAVAGQTLVDTAAGRCLRPEERSVGFVFQESLLFPHMTVKANLRYGERWRRRKRRSVSFDRVVEVLEIGHLLGRYPHNLSGGERQRVALGRALLSGPELLLMDEPLAALDAALKARVLAYLERVVAEWDVPTLFVTHAQADVRRAADQVILVDKGRLLASGPPDEVLTRREPLSWTDAAGPVNLLRIERLEPCGDETHVRIGEQVLHLPARRPAGEAPHFVQFSPSDVVLSRRDIPDLSCRNHLVGRVRQVVRLDDSVFVAVDVGQILWAVVTPQSASDLGIENGCEVTCLMKVHALKFVG